jgi:hypothetical protein
VLLADAPVRLIRQSTGEEVRMSTVATVAPRRGLTPVQKSMFLQLFLAIFWAIVMGQIFHSFRPVFMYLMATWMTAIVLQPAMPLPWRWMVSSTFSAAVFISGFYYLLSRLGWP